MSESPEFGQNLGRPADRRDTVGWGVLKVFLWNVGHAIVGFATMSQGGAFLLLVFGALELVYVVPLAIHAARTGRREQMKGIIIAGSIGVLLTATCWGVLLGALRGANLH